MDTTTQAITVTEPTAIVVNETLSARCSALGRILDYSPRKYLHWLAEGSAPSSASVQGTILHALMLGGLNVVCIDYDTMHSKAAKAAWKEAVDAGLTPLLRSHFLSMTEAACYARHLFERRFGEGALDAATKETGYSREFGGIILTGTPDIVFETPDCVYIVEVKSTPDFGKFRDIIYSSHYDAQSAGYRHLVAGTTDKPVEHSYLVIERKEPHCGGWCTEDGYSEVVGEGKLACAAQKLVAAKLDGYPDYEPVEHSPRPYQLQEWS